MFFRKLFKMDYVPPTVDKKDGDMGFSAEDGLMLAVFFAVVMSVALLIRCICVRYCNVKCAKCQHKQDPATHDDQLSSVVVGNSRRQSQSSVRSSEPETIDAALLERTFTTDPCNTSICALAVDSSSGATCNSPADGGPEGNRPRADPCHSCRRGRRVSLVPPSSMETLFEEEEGEDPQPPCSKLFMEGAASRASPKESGVVYTIYTFPHGNSSPEVLRTSTTVVTSLSGRPRAQGVRGLPETHSTSSSVSSTTPSNFDLPTYDELFPPSRSSETNPLQSPDPNTK